MGLFPYSDVIGFPNVGPPQSGQRLGDALVMPPKGTSNWMQFIHSDGYMPGMTGAWEYQLLTNRYVQPTINIIVSG